MPELILAAAGALFLGAGIAGLYLHYRHMAAIARLTSAFLDGEFLDGRVVITRYAVSYLPYGSRDRRHYELHVARRPRNRWVVQDAWDQYLTVDGAWVSKFELPDQDRYWMSLDDALNLAQMNAAVMDCNGVGVHEALARMEAAESGR